MNVEKLRATAFNPSRPDLVFNPIPDEESNVYFHTSL